MAPRKVVLEVGDIFANDFKVVSPLSEGGMGMVYVAEQISTGRRRALKLMLPQLVADPKLRARFEQEARIGSKIASEHIIEVVGAGVDAANSIPWLAMELLEGEDLLALVRRVGALPPKAILNILAQLGHAIGAAHSVSIVHRDLKPENIFIAESKQAGAKYIVKVLDFGIAKLVADAKTMHTQALGSPGWMAPEQTARDGVVGPQADVWAIGLIAFFLLTGKNVWRSADDETATAAHLLRETLHDPMPVASARAAEVGQAARIPAGFDAWFARSTDRSPNGRFSDARAQFEALRPLLENAPAVVGVSKTVAQAPAAAAFVTPIARSRMPLVIAGAVLFALMVSAVFYFAGSKDHPPISAASSSSAPIATPSETPAATDTLTPLLAASASTKSTATTPSHIASATDAPVDRASMTAATHAADSSLETIKGHLSDCERVGGMTGEGRANVTFQPNGSVSDATMLPPYAGTSSGSCVAAMFRGAHIPPYAGKPITIGIPFSL